MSSVRRWRTPWLRGALASGCSSASIQLTNQSATVPSSEPPAGAAAPCRHAQWRRAQRHSQQAPVRRPACACTWCCDVGPQQQVGGVDDADQPPRVVRHLALGLAGQLQTRQQRARARLQRAAAAAQQCHELGGVGLAGAAARHLQRRNTGCCVQALAQLRCALCCWGVLLLQRAPLTWPAFLPGSSLLSSNSAPCCRSTTPRGDSGSCDSSSTLDLRSSSSNSRRQLQHSCLPDALHRQRQHHNRTPQACACRRRTWLTAPALQPTPPAAQAPGGTTPPRPPPPAGKHTRPPGCPWPPGTPPRPAAALAAAVPAPGPARRRQAPAAAAAARRRPDGTAARAAAAAGAGCARAAAAAPARSGPGRQLLLLRLAALLRPCRCPRRPRAPRSSPVPSARQQSRRQTAARRCLRAPPPVLLLPVARSRQQQTPARGLLLRRRRRSADPAAAAPLQQRSRRQQQQGWCDS